jgi:hypothetical protein
LGQRSGALLRDDRGNVLRGISRRSLAYLGRLILLNRLSLDGRLLAGWRLSWCLVRAVHRVLEAAQRSSNGRPGIRQFPRADHDQNYHEDHYQVNRA